MPEEIKRKSSKSRLEIGVRGEFATMLDTLEKNGIIMKLQPGHPPTKYLTNAFPVPRSHSKNGAVRMVVDYSKRKPIFLRTPVKQDNPSLQSETTPSAPSSPTPDAGRELVACGHGQGLSWALHGLSAEKRVNEAFE